MSHADSLLAGLRAYLTAAEQFATDHDGQADTTSLANAAHYADQLDKHLSGGGNPPAAWAPDLAALPGEVGVTFHPSVAVPGATNLELDGPTGHRFRVHVNDGLALDLIVPGDTSPIRAACVACGLTDHPDHPAPGALADRLTVLHVRDPDGECNVTVWHTDGAEVGAGVEDVDAGAGHDWEDWSERITDAQALPPSDYRTELLAVLGDPPGSKYIDGRPDTD